MTDSDQRSFDDFGDILSVRQAAKLLGVSENSLREYIRRDEVPGVLRLGRRVLLLKDKLRSAFEGGEWK